MYWPRNCCTPSVIVWVESDEVRINGNHRSFQIGTMVNTATVAMAGRSSGATTSKKMRVSGTPSQRAASRRSFGICWTNSLRMKIDKGKPWAM